MQSGQQRVQSRLATAFGLLYALCVSILLVVCLVHQEALLDERCEAQRLAMTRLLVQVQNRLPAAYETQVLNGLMAEQERGWAGALSQFRSWVGGAAVLSLALGLLGAKLTARLLTAPMERLRGDIAALASGVPLPASGSGAAPAFEKICCEAGGPARAGAGGAVDPDRDEWQELREELRLMVHGIQQRMAQLELATREREFSSRLAEIGAMAATVAHEVRNPLNTIEGAVYYLKSAYGGNSDVREYAQLIEEQVARLTSVVSRLSDVNRPLEATKQATDLNELVRDTVLRLVREGPTQRVDVELRLSPDLPAVPVDRHQVKQILENLVENSLQAMQGQGKIAVETTLDGGSQIVLKLSDDGPGIRQEDHGRVFEPFFTTRVNGTGLGLYIVSRYVKAHGGSVTLDPAPGLGARFEIRLPLGLEAPGGREPLRPPAALAGSV